MSRSIIILQMGKVGSWTIIKTIQSASSADIRLTSLDDAHLYADAIIHTHDTDAVHGYLLSEQRQREDREIVVLSAVRDPLRCAIAHFFQNFADPIKQEMYLGSKEEISLLPIGVIVRAFRERAGPLLQEYMEPWLDKFSTVVGQDIFKAPLSESGIVSGESDLLRFYILRIEHIEQSMPTIDEALGTRIEKVYDENVSSKKWYAKIYKDFLAELNPNLGELELFYGSRLSRHFYREAEIDLFMRKWW